MDATEPEKVKSFLEWKKPIVFLQKKEKEHI